MFHLLTVNESLSSFDNVAAIRRRNRIGSQNTCRKFDSALNRAISAAAPVRNNDLRNSRNHPQTQRVNK